MLNRSSYFGKPDLLACPEPRPTELSFKIGQGLSTEKNQHKCLNWLNEQCPSMPILLSVIVGYGSIFDPILFFLVRVKETRVKEILIQFIRIIKCFDQSGDRVYKNDKRYCICNYLIPQGLLHFIFGLLISFHISLTILLTTILHSVNYIN